MINAIIFAFAFLLPTVWSLPLVIRDAVAPPITKPDGSTTWKVGDTVQVTWDTSGLPPPANVTNPTAKIILGSLEGTDENLMFDTPLAQGFSIFAGTVSFSVPDVPPKENYIVCLFGDSGNISPIFSITGGTASSAVSSTVASEISKVTPVPPITTAPFPSTTTDVVTSSTSVAPSSTPSGSVSVPVTSTSTSSVASASSSGSASSSSSASPSGTAIGAIGGNNNAAWSSKEVQLSSIAFSALLALALL
ncbi:hypothetical protein QCA50_007041 [Cerrena zonata]|uniref:Yeast cell wall synthesis Kre9/Knh1-like N-terminal domain-containing protein n=1 Tax=Cerrena zonata TaxID=2478898 RepID=A0AAW0G9R6_9APHY